MLGTALTLQRCGIYYSPDTRKGAGPSVCISHAESLQTSPPPPFSAILWWGVKNEHHLVGVTDKEDRSDGLSSGSVCPPNQGLDAMNRTGNFKAYSWPGAHPGDTVHLPPG